MRPITLTRRQSDLLVFAFFLALTVVGAALTFSFPSPLLPGYPGSAMFPRIVLGAMGVLCVFGLARSLLSRERRPGTITLPLGPLVLAALALGAFVAVLTVAGMEPAVFAFIAGGYFLRSRNVVLSLIFGLGGVVVVYFVFVEALSVRLPLLFLPRYLFHV